MVNGGHKVVALFKPLTVLLGDLEVGLDKSHCRNSAKAYDDLGVDESDLLADNDDILIVKLV